LALRAALGREPEEQWCVLCENAWKKGYLVPLEDGHGVGNCSPWPLTELKEIKNME
jgi:hypothetical protein